MRNMGILFKAELKEVKQYYQSLAFGYQSIAINLLKAID